MNAPSESLFFELKLAIEQHNGQGHISEIVIFDGDCPFCSDIVLHTKLQIKFPHLIYVNARDFPEAYLILLRHEIDLDRTMAFVTKNNLFVGEKALGFLLKNANETRFSICLLNLILRIPYISSTVYLLLSWGRRATLALFGRRTFRSTFKKQGGKMNLTPEEIAGFDRLLKELKKENLPPNQKLMVTPGLIIAAILTTLSGLCLTAEQKAAVDKLIEESGNLPLNASLSEIMAARRKVFENHPAK